MKLFQTIAPWRHCAVAVAVGFAVTTPFAAVAAEAVDLELVLATDVSRSISAEEAYLQREGTAAAFKSPEVTRAIALGANGKIAVAYVDWSVDYLNRVIVDWRIINSKESAEAFADELLKVELTPGQRTSISSALQMSAQMIDANSYEGTRKVIDISGHGQNNAGLPLAPVREDVIANGIVVNGLPIILKGEEFAGRNFTPEIDKYYARCVIGGRGSFLIVARGFKDFAVAIRHKLIMEISALPNPIQYADTRGFIRLAAAQDLTQFLKPLLPNANGPVIVRPPATRDTDCDQRGGFGGFGGFQP